ncbi:MAG: hypothetical protein ACEPOW_04990 [Bacteroidales bacterium]
MKLLISTKVNQNYKKVFLSFDKLMFEKITPGKRFFTLKKFQGTKPGHRFVILFPFNQKWKGIITEKKETPDYCYFTDEGITLPFGLAQWRHRHWIIKENNSTSIITEDIHFKGRSVVLSYLIYPMIWLFMFARKGKYKSFFN